MKEASTFIDEVEALPIMRVDRTWQYPNRVCAAQGPIVMIKTAPVRLATER